MSQYTTFDANIQCEEFNAVSESEYDEVMQMMAEESEGFALMPETEQAAFEAEQDSLKDWLGNYSNIDNGATYNGIAI
jgi:hypothetical protein